VFYYPALFKLRKLGTTRALIVATLYVFVLTWLLHSYQWFWLRGSILLAWHDILFWAILGVLVVGNALYEMRYGRPRSLSRPTTLWDGTLTRALKAYATFWVICILWSFWTAESLADWFSLWPALRGRYTAEVFLYPALVFAVILLGSIARAPVRNIRGSEQPAGEWLQGRAATVASMVLLVAISIEGVSTKLGAEAATFIHSLRSGQLSRLDTAKLERGYYENLLSVERFNSQLWEVYTKRPANWLDVETANLKRFVGGFAKYELNPSFVSSTKYGTISINRFGMRDQDYDINPEPGTFRAAVLGASLVMGWGVADGQTFEALVEERLNRDNAGAPFARYELLNFGVPGYDPPQQLTALERAVTFRPTAVFYVATGREIHRSARHLVTAIREGTQIPYDGLREILAAAGVRAGMDEATGLRRLAPYRREMLSYVYRHIVERCLEHGILPVWIFLPQVREGNWQEETPEAVAIAEAAGFVVINLEDVYRGHDVDAIRLAEWDDHPNLSGHQLIARRLYDDLLARRQIIFDGARGQAQGHYFKSRSSGAP
jgi:hypothetical protein